MQTMKECGNRAVFLGLGSNRGGVWGPPAQTMERCLDELPGHVLTLCKSSSLYETVGVGPGRNSVFVNAAVCGETHLSPEALLSALKGLERRAGPRSAMPWGPRALDIDILSYKGLVLGWPPRCGRDGRLVIPHPALHDRPFVLAPLAEIAPEWRHPVLGVTARELWRRLPGRAAGGVLRRLEGGVPRV